MNQSLAYEAADAAVAWLERNVTGSDVARAIECAKLEKKVLARARGEGNPSSVLWNSGSGAESLSVANASAPGVHKGVGQLDESQCYLQQFKASECGHLAAIASDPIHILGQDKYAGLCEPATKKIWYTRLYGKMELTAKLKAFARLARIRNAVYVALIVKRVLADYPHLMCLAAAFDSITFQGFQSHAEFRQLSERLSSMCVRRDMLRQGVLEECTSEHEEAFTVTWKRELPHESASSGLAVGVFSGKSNLYLLVNPEDENPKTSVKAVPGHMLGANLSQARSGSLSEQTPIDSQALFERVLQAMQLCSTDAHAELLNILNEFFPRRSKASWAVSITKKGKVLRGEMPWLPRLLLDATGSSSSVCKRTGGTYYKRDAAVTKQSATGTGYVVQVWSADGGKKYEVVQNLLCCLQGCYHPLFIGRGVRVRACCDWDMAFPLKEQWLLSMADALRRFWSDRGHDVSVAWRRSTTMRTDPKKRHASHIIFKCTREEDG